MPRFEQRLSHDQMAAGAGMNSIRNNLLSQCRILLLRFLDHCRNRSVDVREVKVIFVRQLFDELSIEDEARVVPAFKWRRTRSVVVGRRLNESHPETGESRLE